jgi:hypothetical protein
MWLGASAKEIMELAGYARHPLEKLALEFAEESISYVTDVNWGAVVPFVLRFGLSSKSATLPLPIDVQSVAELLPAFPGYTLQISGTDLIAVSENSQFLFPEGHYRITGTRGIDHIPPRIIKAASLLVNYWLGLSDSERSRYAQFAVGDFSGSMRLEPFPVPEAYQLLQIYKNRVGVAIL